MIKIFFLFLIIVSSKNAIADDYLFMSLDQPDLILDLEDRTYTVGSALSNLKICNFDVLSVCIEIGRDYIVAPKSTLHPFKLNLSEDRVLIFLPIKKRKKILNMIIEGYELVVSDLSGNAASKVFFTEEFGILLISVGGVIYWSSEKYGIK